MTTHTEQRTMSNTSYRIMALYLRARERFRKPQEFAKNLGIKEGHRVLDYGCGIGSYTMPVAELVGEGGTVYALDIHPLALERVRKRTKKTGITNVETILSGLETGLPNEHLDFTLLIDVYTWVPDKEELIAEMHRVLKPSGKLVFLIDHVSPEDCKNTVAASGLFRFISQDENVLRYEKFE
ncbi:MAG: methyltransferase domain-containing protein [Candidatus Thorarchaeota archaeon]|nr:MAG: methyltransferase domain-containing protein [Candidatus Thorarchaeota archaeon]